MIPLLILAAVLLGVTFLLLAPVRLQVDFQKEFSAQVRYLFLRFPLVSAGKEGEAPSMQGPPAEEEPPPSGSGLGRKLRAMLRRQGLRGFLQSLQELALAAENSAKSLLRKIRLKRFDLYICLGGRGGRCGCGHPLWAGVRGGLFSLRHIVGVVPLPQAFRECGSGLPQPGPPGGIFC